MNKVQRFTVDEPAPQEESEGFKLARDREDTRKRIAILFIGGYLAILIMLILLSAFAKLSADTSKDYLLAVGPSLGLVIGYYFKSTEE